MGLTFSSIELSNPVRPSIPPMQVRCHADSGSIYLVLPAFIADQLGIVPLEQRTITLADGSDKEVPYAGPVQVRFDNRSCFVGALIMGDEVLLGAVPMEDMDLVVIPKLLKLSVNPASPHRARGRA